MFLTEEQYLHAVSLYNGSCVKRPLHLELEEFMKEEFKMDIIDYVCDMTKIGKQRLKLVVWNRKNEAPLKDKKGLNYNTKAQKKVAEKFGSLAKKYNMYPAYQNCTEIFVCCDTIQDEMQKRVLDCARRKICSIRHKDIWKIEIIFQSIHFFYQTDEQIERHEADGLNESLIQKCQTILERYDTYHAFRDGVRCVFTSHQTLDEKYAGSMFYYTR